jgi:predicted metalloendopeptidase
VLPHIDRAAVESLARDVIGALAATIERASWLPASRRRLAAAKLAALIPRVAVPHHFEDHDAANDVHLVADGYVANQLEISRSITTRNLALLLHARERDGDFEMRLSAVNAFYEPVRVETSRVRCNDANARLERQYNLAARRHPASAILLARV